MNKTYTANLHPDLCSLAFMHPHITFFPKQTQLVYDSLEKDNLTYVILKIQWKINCVDQQLIF